MASIKAHLVVRPGLDLARWEYKSAVLRSANFAVVPAIAVFAGTGLFGHGADGIPATQSALEEPGGLVQNGSDIDIYDCRAIRAVGPDGVIRTVARAAFEWNCNTSAIGGLALDASRNLLFPDALTDTVDKATPAGAVSAFLDRTAGLHGPTGVAVDHRGNTYISDKYHHMVRRVDPSGTVTQFAGDGLDTGCAVCPQAAGGPAVQAKLAAPVGLAVDAADDVYVTDELDDRVLKITPGGTLAAVIGRPHDGTPGGFSGDGGPAADAELDSPLGVAVDRHGNVFIADAGNRRVREVDAATGTIRTVAGGGTQSPFVGAAPAAAALPPPLAVLVDDADNLYFSTQHLVLKLAAPAPAVSAAQVVTLPAARTCTSRRAFPLHVRRIKGITYRSATVTVNGRRVPVYVYTDRRVRTTTIPGSALNDRRFRAFVDLRGLARGTYTVAITVTTTDGQALHATRRYHTCRASLAGGTPKL
jgi:hypothetical protein